jgi:hypothetical protein
MPILSVDQIVQANDLGESEVEMPEWDGSVIIRGLGYGEWVDLREQASTAGEQDEKLFSRLLLSTALVEPHVTTEQADLLLAKSTPAVNRLVEAILKLSNIGTEAVIAAEAGFQG